jgi:DNA polymerase III subunit alpha
MSAGFVHLHVHSDYSVLDGLATVPRILDRCSEFGMDACALTDHGNLFGAISFYTAAKDRGIKPIIGSELYVAPARRDDFEARVFGSAYHHFLLLCKDETGYHNLCKLSTAGYLEGFYMKPRVDDELLAKYHEGLIATSACLGGYLSRAILNDNVDAAHHAIEKYVGIFGKENFLIELMDHGIPEQARVNPVLAELAGHHGLRLIATNDSHYIEQSDAEAHEVLLCLQTGANMEDEKRYRFQTDQFYFRSPAEMQSLFAQYPEAISNTEIVADRCNVHIPLNQRLIPRFDPPAGKNGADYLGELVMEGLKERYGDPPPPEYTARAEFEIDIIVKMDFVDYFLVVWDLIRYARDSKIPVGPGRGSGAGSIVAYALRITNVDPMRYGLLFERFLNPDRVSMPDFDIDFCPTRRDDMIVYSKQKYGEANVGQIITFGRMLARAVLRNVGRVLGMPYGEVDRIAKLIPEKLGVTLDKAAEMEPELRALAAADPQVARLWGLALRLEGTIATLGTHAAGVVISDQPLTDHVALFQARDSNTVATQAEMNCIEKIGLLKMDYLGLRNLTVIHEAVRLIEKERGIRIDIDNLEPNDEAAYLLLRSGHTAGIFQLESAGMRDLAKRIGLHSIEEMSALVALYRPGPMEFIDTYVQNKFNPEMVQYEHPLLEKILEETYGIAVYQEQVMQIVQGLAGFTLGQADILRRAMGKKKAELMAEQRDKFVDGCQANGIDQRLAAQLFDKISSFAGYGFNKSHAVAYAYVAYQTAYLKANFPVEFMCALLSSETGNLNKVALYIEECRRMEIEVHPPDVNRSDMEFSVDGSTIRFGLGTIKNIGGKPAEAIVAERSENGPFKDIFDFCARLSGRVVNRRLIESLNKAGAFESTGWNRRQVESVLDDALAAGQAAQHDRESGQISLFDMPEMQASVNELHAKPDLMEWHESELLQFEKEMLGLYVTGHPLARHTSLLQRYTTLSLGDLEESMEGRIVNVGGLVSQIKTHITTRGKMAFLTLDTLEGSCEVTIFSDLYEKKAGLLVPDAIVMMQAKISYRNNEPGMIAQEIFTLEEVESHLTRALHVHLQTKAANPETMRKLAGLLGGYRGPCDVYLHCRNENEAEVIVHATSACRVTPSPALRMAIEDLFGSDACFYSAGMGLPTHQESPPPDSEEPRWKRRKAAAAR